MTDAGVAPPALIANTDAITIPSAGPARCGNRDGKSPCRPSAAMEWPMASSQSAGNVGKVGSVAAM